MSLAVVFPGQGSQTLGMGVELAARWPAAARRFAEASEVLGYDLLAVCANGPEDRLGETSVAQPALFTAGYATWEVLQAAGVAPRFVAGHSLGEYTACAAAGVFSFVEGVALVKARGEAMSAAAKARPGAMAAVIGAKAEDVDAWVAQAGAKGPVLVANRNAPDQLIVSGALEAVAEVERLGAAAGARVTRLKVSGAFHSPLMESAADAMKARLAGARLADPAVPVVGNVAALVLRSAAQVREELDVQLVSAVRWDACVRTLAGNGIATLVECGPGRVLAGLVRRIDRSLKVLGTGGAKDVDETLAALKGASSAA